MWKARHKFAEGKGWNRMKRKPQHARKHPLAKKCYKYGRYAGYGALATGVAVTLPTTAAFASPFHGQPPHHQQLPPPPPPTITHSDDSYTVYCEYTTPLDMSTPIPVIRTESITTTRYPASSPSANSTSTIVGVVTVKAPSGRTLRFAENYQYTSANDITYISGWALVGPGAFGGDLTYLEGGTASMDHYGSVLQVTGRTFSVCAALGA